MSNLKNIVVQLRYPYTALVIMIIWLGSAALLAIQPSISIVAFVISNCLASIFVAVIGFQTRH